MSSVVQLGVSIHLGTALLQLYGEFGVQPLIRIIDRIKVLFADSELQISDADKREFSEIESDFAIFKIRLFNEYTKFFKLNSIVATALFGILIYLAFVAQEAVPQNNMKYMVLIAALSSLPAPVTLYLLWSKASSALAPLIKRADRLEGRILQCAAQGLRKNSE